MIPKYIREHPYLVLPSGFTFAAPGMMMIILFVSTMLPLRIDSLAIICLLSWVARLLSRSRWRRSLTSSLRFVYHKLVGESACGASRSKKCAEHQFVTAPAIPDSRGAAAREKEALAGDPERSARDPGPARCRPKSSPLLGQLVGSVAQQVQHAAGAHANDLDDDADRSAERCPMRSIGTGSPAMRPRRASTRLGQGFA